MRYCCDIEVGEYYPEMIKLTSTSSIVLIVTIEYETPRQYIYLELTKIIGPLEYHVKHFSAMKDEGHKPIHGVQEIWGHRMSSEVVDLT
jgi:hypothetical protein